MHPSSSDDGLYRRQTLHVRESPDSPVVYIVPVHGIHQAPNSRSLSSRRDLSRFFRCTAYDPAVGVSSCPAGAACRNVHIDRACARVHELHEDRRWLTIEEVPFPRCPEMGCMSVLPVRRGDPAEVVSVSHILITRAVLPGHHHTPPRHCAHFARKRRCDLGTQCNFVHVIRLGTPGRSATTAKRHAVAAAADATHAKLDSVHVSTPPTTGCSPTSLLPYELPLPTPDTISRAPSFTTPPGGPSPRNWPFRHNPYGAEPRSPIAAARVEL
jgi:hypothetical protein